MLRCPTVATDLIEIDPSQPSQEAMERAASAVRQGKVVSIPTDALYTLIADPFNLRAVSQVFIAKGREPNRSLPLLVDSAMMVEDLSREISKRFYLLSRRFWPGPLTIILPAAKVPLKVTGNTGRLAVRQSRSEVANRIIALLGQPIISTSANISGSPTCASGIDVFGTMDGRVDLVLDGGTCTGEGSSTVDITEPYWRMIKEGAVAEKEIAECLKGS
jgi:L-threonylcarbamoyladenylate synthase